MIKVYLDWNCITHSKDSFAELKEALKQYGHVFICPYSVAHLRDLLTNFEANRKEYEKDLDLLTDMCGEHMLILNGDNMNLFNVSPKDYLVDNADSLDFLQNKFKFPYNNTRELLRIAFNPADIHRISVENNPQNVIPLVNGIVNSNLRVFDSIDSLLETSNSFRTNTLEIRIKEVYYALDMLGYKSEDKKKSFANIDTDAQHIATACLCDYLISDDRRMRDKAKTIFDHIHCATKVMDPKSFMEEMPRIVEQCYDDELIPKAMHSNGIPTIKEDGAHFQALDYPLWGAFKFCHNATAISSTLPTNMAYFLPDHFMFYDELRPLAVITSLALPESQREEQIERYIQSFVQSKPIENFAFHMKAKNYIYDCVLFTLDRLPALQVRCTDMSGK